MSDTDARTCSNGRDVRRRRPARADDDVRVRLGRPRRPVHPRRPRPHRHRRGRRRPAARRRRATRTTAPTDSRPSASTAGRRRPTRTTRPGTVSVRSPRAGSTASTYDARDRLTRAGADTYAWAPDGSLASISRPSGTTTFAYDELGRLRAVAASRRPDRRLRRRRRRTAGRTRGRRRPASGYLYDPAGRVVAQTDGSGAVVARFAYDDQGHLATMQKGAETYRIVTDAVGSPRLVVDAATGAVAEAIDYDAWGRITDDTTPGFIPFGFAGGLSDPDTGLVHFGARDYDPSTGRWTASDPIRFEGGDADLYRYVADDPVDRTDPAGTASVATGICVETARGTVVTPTSTVVTDPPASGGAGTNATSRTIRSRVSGSSACGMPASSRRASSATRTSIPATASTTTSRQPGSSSPRPRRTAVSRSNRGSSLSSAGRQITFNTAVAALVDGDRVGVYADEPSFLVVNGKAVTAADIAERLPGGGSLERHGGTVTVRWTDGSSLTATEDARTLELTFAPSTVARLQPPRLAGRRERRQDRRPDRARRHRPRPVGSRLRDEGLQPVRGQLADRAVRVPVRLPAGREHRDLHRPEHPVRPGHGRLDPGGRQGHGPGDLPGGRRPVRAAPR